MKEIIDLRKPREKHFLNDDGTITLYAYDSDIHYLNNDKYEEIDNTLIETKEGFQNNKNNFKMTLFKENDTNKILRVEQESFYLEYSMEQSNKNSTIKKIEESVFYQNILNDIDLKYVIQNNKLKDYITLKSPKSNLKDLKFKIKTNLNLNYSKEGIEVKDQNQMIYFIEKPTLMDKNNEYYPIHYQLEKIEDYYYLSFQIADAILSKEELYPFIIDPTITNKPTGSVYDTYIYPGDENTNRNDTDILKVGVDKDNKIYRTLIKFDLPVLGTACEIVNATAALVSHASDYIWKGEYYKKNIINVHKILEPWTEENANWKNMSDKYDERIEEFFYAKRSEVLGEDETLNTTAFSITNLVKRWYSGEANNGILLKFEKEVYDKDCKEYSFYSKNNSIATDKIADPKPYLIVTYRNFNGLENYMTYQTIHHQQGQSYINNLTGNLTNVFEVNKTLTGKSPINLSLIYNTNDVVLNNDFGLPKGYKFNYYQTIKEIKIEEQEYLEYLDMDGTLHYFSKQEQVYVDEEGLNLTAQLENSKYQVIDKKGNKMIFEKMGKIYYLSELIDTATNHTIIAYENGKIVSLTDANNQKIQIIYNSDKITITSNYNITNINLSNSLIITINTKLGTTELEYNTNGIVTKIKDTNGLKTKFDYYDSIPYRVKKVSEIALNDNIGNTLEFVYGFLVTRIMDQKGRINTYTFNNQGNTIGITNLKSNDDFTNSYGIYKVFDNDSNKNKLLLSTDMSKYTNNLFENHSFEDINITKYDKAEVVKENARSGNYCLKIKEITKISLPNVKQSGEYTFSGYFKNSNYTKLELIDQNDAVIEYFDIKVINNDYKRYHLTGYIHSNKSYYIKITPLNNSEVYLDDIQYEPGSIANYVNIVENSNFEKEFANWTREGSDSLGNKISDFDEIITLDNGVKAYKRKNRSDASISMSQIFKYAGKKNETFKLSFWYKNEGIIDNQGDYNGNLAFVSFTYLDDIPGHPFICYLNTHASEWQYFQMTFTTIADYDNVFLNFISQNEVNNLYITNITLTKDLEANSFVYDENGNLISATDFANEKSKFSYDKNNQLISVFDPQGNNFKFEYDNTDSSKILQGISKSGIANIIEYDEYQNPIKTKIINQKIDANTNILCKIRLKGTKKYLFADKMNNKLFMKEEECNTDTWLLENLDENKYFYIKYLDYYLGTSNIDISNCILVKNKEKAQSFELISNDNGSYTLKKSGNTNESLTYETENFYFKEINYEKDDNQQFYLENIDKAKYVETKSEYTNDGKYLTKLIDSLNKETLYDYDNITGLITRITNPKGVFIEYFYDDKERITKITKENKNILYVYNSQDLLSKIIVNNKEYIWTYDEFLREKEIKLGKEVLVTNYYEPNNGNLIKTVFGNQHYLKYSYDELDRMCKVSKDDDVIYNFIYNNENDLVKITSEEESYEYYYDFAKRLSKYLYNKNEVDYDYNSNSNITSKKYNIYNKEYLIQYAYDEDGNIIQLTHNNHYLKYEYDCLGRIIRKNLDDKIFVDYNYYSNGDKQSFVLKSMKVQSDLYEYIYDNGYNITHIFKNKKLILKYEYDKLDCLVREDNFINNITTFNNYDNSGNMILRKYCNLDTNEIIHQDEFQYANKSWEDQLTKFNDVIIKYDKIGNPIKIGDATLTWKHGNELSKFQSDKINASYTYNKDGIRTRKKVNNISTEYFIENNCIVSEKINNDIIYYMRDDNENLIGFTYNNDIYYYQKNMQEDIIGIYDNNYNLIATYEYDSWGKILKISDINGNEITDLSHIAHINPYRYRSYYFDRETELYYLNSRYYNPNWCRFLNADTLISSDTGIMGYNMYIYCNNDPIKRKDSEGHFGFFCLVTMCVAAIVTVAAVSNNIKQNKKAKNEIKQVQEKNKNKPKVNNNEFKNTLKNNVNKITSEISPKSNIISKSLKFKDKVCTDCEYDLKKQEPWKDNTIYYDGHWMEAQDVGNYNYGYMGAALKFPLIELLAGASYAQLDADSATAGFCLSTSVCDDPRDTYYIKLGFKAYKRDQKKAD